MLRGTAKTHFLLSVSPRQDEHSYFLFLSKSTSLKVTPGYCEMFSFLMHGRMGRQEGDTTFFLLKDLVSSIFSFFVQNNIFLGESRRTKKRLTRSIGESADG